MITYQDSQIIKIKFERSPIESLIRLIKLTCYLGYLDLWKKQNINGELYYGFVIKIMLFDVNFLESDTNLLIRLTNNFIDKLIDLPTKNTADNLDKILILDSNNQLFWVSKSEFLAGCTPEPEPLTIEEFLMTYDLSTLTTVNNVLDDDKFLIVRNNQIFLLPKNVLLPDVEPQPEPEPEPEPLPEELTELMRILNNNRFFPGMINAELSIQSVVSTDEIDNPNPVFFTPFILNSDRITELMIICKKQAEQAGINYQITIWSNLNGKPNAKLWESDYLNLSTPTPDVIYSMSAAIPNNVNISADIVWVGLIYDLPTIEFLSMGSNNNLGLTSNNLPISGYSVPSTLGNGYDGIVNNLEENVGYTPIVLGKITPVS